MIQVKVAPASNPKQIVTIRLNARKTVDGNIMIYDHPNIDVAIDAVNGKVVAFPKIKIDDEVYATAKRLFDYLRKEGVIIHDSVQGGNTFWSMEATYPKESKDGDPIQFLLYSIYRFMQDDLPEVEFAEDVRNIHKKDLLDPSVDDSTELGEVPPEEKKGSLDNKAMPWGSAYRTFFEGLSNDDAKLLNEIMQRDFRPLQEQRQMPRGLAGYVHLLQRAYPQFTWKVDEDYGDEVGINGTVKEGGEVANVYVLTSGITTKATVTLTLFSETYEKYYHVKGDPVNVVGQISRLFAKEFGQMTKLFGGVS